MRRVALASRRTRSAARASWPSVRSCELAFARRPTAGHRLRRSTYAEGSVDAACFLASRIKAASEQKVYDMVDVLKLGGI